MSSLVSSLSSSPTSPARPSQGSVWSTFPGFHDPKLVCASGKEGEASADGWVKLSRTGRCVFFLGRLPVGRYILDVEVTSDALLPKVGYKFGLFKRSPFSPLPQFHSQSFSQSHSHSQSALLSLLPELKLQDLCHQFQTEPASVVASPLLGELTSATSPKHLPFAVYNDDESAWILAVKGAKTLRPVSVRMHFLRDSSQPPIEVIQIPRPSSPQITSPDPHLSSTATAATAAATTSSPPISSSPPVIRHVPTTHSSLNDEIQVATPSTSHSLPPPSSLSVFGEDIPEVRVHCEKGGHTTLPLPRGTFRLMFGRSDKLVTGPKVKLRCRLQLHATESEESPAIHTSSFSFGGMNHRSHVETLVVEREQAFLHVFATISHLTLAKLGLRKDTHLCFKLRVFQISSDSSSAPLVTLANVEAEDVLLLFINKETLTGSREYSLLCEPGHYHFSARNSGKLAATLPPALTAALTVSALDRPPQQIVSPKLLPDTKTWTQQFVFDQPTSLTLVLSPVNSNILQTVICSAKLVRVPDPMSITAINKKARKLTPIVIAVSAVLAFLSYLFQVLSFILNLHIGSLSVRFVLLIGGSVYAYFHREEIVEMTKDMKASSQSFFETLDRFDDSTGLAKLNILSELSKKKKQKKLAQNLRF